MAVMEARRMDCDETDALRRNALFDENAVWARTIALAIYRRLWGRGIDPADCIQNAIVGLLEAIPRFDADRGIPFRAYAAARVRGAVFNGLRDMRMEAKPAPTTRLRDRVRCLAEDASGSDDLTFFSDLVGSLGLGFLIEDAWAAVDERDACGFAELQQTRMQLSDALARLPERQRDLLYQHYFLHRPFFELAQEAGVTKGRISQLHHEALRRLRQMLAG